MEIRLLNSGDLEQYRELRLRALKEDPPAFVSSYEEEKDFSDEYFCNFLEGKGFWTYGAWVDESLVGIITLSLDQRLKRKHIASLGTMFVIEGKRNLGIGRKLMKVAIDKAKSLEGVEQIYLVVITKNKSAQKLYSSLGFERYGLEPNGLKLSDGSYEEQQYLSLFI